jgi:hypothetical protein
MAVDNGLGEELLLTAFSFARSLMACLMLSNSYRIFMHHSILISHETVETQYSKAYTAFLTSCWLQSPRVHNDETTNSRRECDSVVQARRPSVSGVR